MKVLFVNMPFAGIRPAIGISLLQARLHSLGAEAQTVYLNMRFAQRLGAEAYTQICEQSPIPSLAGDWVFSEAVFGQRADTDAEYLRAFTERFAAPASQVAALRAARANADRFLDDALNEIDWAAWDVIGFTSTFHQNLASIALAQRIKQRHPEVIVAFGGANCEGEMGLSLLRNFACIDLVCCGEADLSFPAVIKELNAGRAPAGISGVAYRTTEGHVVVSSPQPELVRDLDDLPQPDYDDYFAELDTWRSVDTRYRTVLMESSRGCWWGERHHCTFCGLNGLTMAFRSKSAQRVLAELLALQERYRPAFVEMVDNIMDMHYFRDLLPALRGLGLDLGLFFEVKANLTKDQVRAMRAAGIRTVQPGIESFSDDVLARMRKGTTTLQNVQLLKWCREFGVEAYWNLLYGFPGEDPNDYTEMARLLRSLSHLQPPQAVGAVRLDRFSPYFTEQSPGMRNVRPDSSYALVYALPANELASLAYYFQFDYDDGRNPHQYATAIRTEVQWWHEHARGRLVSVDHGQALAIWDMRPGAKRTLTILSGAQRAAYLFCDRHRSRAAVEGLLAQQGCDVAAVSTFFTDLIDARLLLEMDGRVLALAVPEPGQPSRPASRIEATTVDGAPNAGAPNETASSSAARP